MKWKHIIWLLIASVILGVLLARILPIPHRAGI